jgi:hypothetical protein
MPAPKGYCWLCNKYGKLTKEHIPPESAFNDCPLVLMKINERSRTMEWEPKTSYQKGLCFRSLCEKCNNRWGSKYGGAYVDLVKRVAERIGDVQYFHKISILDVRRPLAILKQVMLQFVTANGSGFVRSNDWVGPFIRQPENTDIPRDIGIYLFASNDKGSRSSGVSAHHDLVNGKTNIVSEFTFWPLGTVISFGRELPHDRLTPIHQWARYPFDYKGLVDLHLSVNPIATEYPIDFRTRSQVEAGAATDVEIKKPSEETSRDLMNRAMKISGDTEDWVYSGHPNTVSKIADQKKSDR